MSRWSEIPGYAGRYRVSDCGDVQSNHCHGPLHKRAGWWSLSRPLARSGHELVYLWDSGTQTRVRRLVHQLVAEAFIPRIEGKSCVNHIDGDKRNNNSENLEWCTNGENVSHAWRTGLCKPEKLTEEKVRQILTFPANDTITGAHFGVSQVWVTRIRARKAWKHITVPT